MENKLCKYCETEKSIDNFRKNRLKCKDCERKHGREYRKSEHGKQKAKTWSDDNKERHQQLQSDWAKNNRAHINEKYNVRIKTDFQFRIKKFCQSHLLSALKGPKTKRTMEHFSCSVEFFIEWLTFCFDDNMTMENHGTYWHLDHVFPVSLFDLEDEEHKRLCFHYLNYMPLPAKDNFKKHNNILNSQLVKHNENIINFHKEKDLRVDKKYSKLLARYLIITGNPLEL